MSRETTTGLSASAWLCGLVLVALSGCVSHPVGPARTYAKYEGKAATTAESALSAVETVRLAAQTTERGGAFGPYVSVMVSEQEESLSALQGTLRSIQPPGERADRLREDLNRLLSDALEHVSDVRVAVRRGQLEALDEVARPLDEDARRLHDFTEAHK